MSLTYTTTYTVADIKRVVDSFAADYDMIAQATGLETQNRVTDTVHDIKVLAEQEYVASLNIVLQDKSGSVIKARKYVVSTDASLWSSERPGNNLWPHVANGSLVVVVSYTQKWRNMSAAAKNEFRKNRLLIKWSPSEIDTNYPGLSGRVDRHYASNSYGMKRTTYT